MYIIRHGHSLHNTRCSTTNERTGDRFWKYGNDDILGLTEVGISGIVEMTARLSESLKEDLLKFRGHYPYATTTFSIYCSPAIRAQQTASLILSQLVQVHGLNPLRELEKVRGAPVPEIPGKFPEVVKVGLLREVPTPKLGVGFEGFEFSRYESDVFYEFKGQSYARAVEKWLGPTDPEDIKFVNYLLTSVAQGPCNGMGLIVGHHYSLSLCLLTVLNAFWEDLFQGPKHASEFINTNVDERLVRSMHKFYINHNRYYDLVDIGEFLRYKQDRSFRVKNSKFLSSLFEHLENFGLEFKS